ncbi:endonuclease [Vibrio mediterranei]|uniref:Endonuclease n=2 Tax=Vibrio mediterranei TaxID=689 RepID=A0ABX5DCQ2_9VIBR|nr:GIY-YIG nuclease family protein [Vibrio mediterranei]MCG9657597.1 GIY-YIG nuclease family protein [Vibrio mediterranei]MCG9666154.1 GIY-YIG nuclease family protein [Vibrio mediterranei]PCD87777.1 endonuclease [Vibrio mediterranei]PRQ67465.1 endonuclease [Vibrio mediterranei]PTC02941.1 endonuclease [Vibrio mediterranei]
MKQASVYILSSRSNKVLYVGVTSQLKQRIWQHKNGVVDGFSKKYHVNKLVFFEVHQSMTAAITREKQIKRWKRDWKENLIKSMNPNWMDLYDSL